MQEWAWSTTDSTSGDGFRATYLELKGWATWDERRTLGINRESAKRLVEGLREKLPDDLKPRLLEMSLGGLLNHKIRINCQTGYALELRGCLQEIIQDNAVKVNDREVYVVTERSPAQKGAFHCPGENCEL
jgi:hypothetical protein